MGTDQFWHIEGKFMHTEQRHKTCVSEICTVETMSMHITKVTDAQHHADECRKIKVNTSIPVNNAYTGKEAKQTPHFP